MTDQPPKQLMNDILNDQAGIRARLDQIDRELSVQSVALAAAVICVLCLSAAVFIALRAGERS